jgi:hypothetical protein
LSYQKKHSENFQFVHRKGGPLPGVEKEVEKSKKRKKKGQKMEQENG